MKNLISMIDFVLGQEITIEVQSITNQWSSRVARYNKIISYARFLKQPLELWMFVPCDENENVLEMPHPSNYNMQADVAYDLYNEDIQRFMQEKERCLFDGFRFENESIILEEKLLIPISHLKNNTIDDFVNRYNYIQLTKTALKQLE